MFSLFLFYLLPFPVLPFPLKCRVQTHCYTAPVIPITTLSLLLFLLKPAQHLALQHVKPLISEEQACIQCIFIITTNVGIINIVQIYTFNTNKLAYNNLIFLQRYCVHICSTGGLLIQARSQTVKSFFFNKSWSISTLHIPIYIFPSHRVLSSPAVTLLSILQRFRAAHPCRNDLLWDLEALSAVLRLFGEGLRHFMWNSKEWWQSVVPTVLLLKALIAECTQNLHAEMKGTVTCRVQPSLLVWWWGGMGEQKVSLMATFFDSHSC